MGKARPAPKRPASPSPSTYRKAARVAPSNSWSGSEAHHDLPEPVKVEQDIARVSQQPHSSMTADQETSTIHDLTLSSSYADMEDLDECDGGSMSSSNKSGYESSIDENGSRRVKYNPSKEPIPKMPLHHENFFYAESLALQIPVEILNTIKDSECRGQGVNYVRNHAKLAKKIDSPGDVLVGLTGDSGTGKSAVVNSLLGIEDIAPSGNEGEACTAVVQEFRERDESQTLPYESEIVFFDQSARNKALRGWVTDFWDCEDANADLSDAHFLDNADGASTAATALFSLFCDRPECMDIDKTQEFLRTAAVRGDPVIISKLQLWTENWLKRHKVWNDKVTMRSHTPDGLRDKTTRYMRHAKKNGEWMPSPWPLVRIIRTFLHAPLLAQGIVLADLPGSSDTNQTRRQASNLYSRDLEYTIVVSNISRAKTDSGTQKYLIDAFKRRRGPSACIVATHSDSLRVSESDLEARIQDANPDDAIILAMLIDQRENITSRLDDIERELAQACKLKDTDAMVNLMEEKEDLNLSRPAQNAKIFEKCVEMRNSQVAEAMGKKYSPFMRDTGRLPVFCVSNSAYMKNIGGYSPTNPPRIGAHATGIPSLRANLLCLPARRKFEYFKHYCQIKLPSLLNSIEIAFNGGLLKEHEDLQDIILPKQNSIPEDVESVFTSLLKDDLLVGIRRIENSKSNYAGYAQSKLASWSKWNYRTYRAFANNSGNYDTKTAGPHDWNCEMLEALVRDLDKDTRHWDNLSVQLTEDLSNIIEERVNALVTKLTAEAEMRRVVLQPFLDELHLQRGYLTARCKVVAENFERDMIVLKDCILTTEDIHESYFVLAMQKAYDEAASITGKGSHRRQCDTLMDHVSDIAEGPFQQMHDKAKAEARKLTKWHAKQLSDEFLKVFQNFHETFLLGCKADEYDPPGLKALRADLQSKIPTLKADLLQINRLLEECK